MKLNKIALAGLVICGSVFLSACGGDSSSSGTPVAQADKTATMSGSSDADKAASATIVTGVLDKSFGFSTGVADFGTTGSTTLKLTGKGAAPAFAISSGADSATGVMTFGSCIFTVTASTFPAGHKLALGSVVPVSPCALKVDTAGKAADGTAVNTNVTLVLNATPSNPVPVVVTISPTGTVSVNGSPVGNTVVVVATGAGN